MVRRGEWFRSGNVKPYTRGGRVIINDSLKIAREERINMMGLLRRGRYK